MPTNHIKHDISTEWVVFDSSLQYNLSLSNTEAPLQDKLSLKT